MSSPTADRQWYRAQAMSGALFSVFLVVHVFNTAAAALGQAAYDGVQAAARTGYHSPVLEVLLLLALVVHVAAGLRRMWRRRGQPGARPPLAARAHRWAGRFLAVVTFGHIAATRGSELWLDTSLGFSGVSITFELVPGYFWPYYAALGLCGWYHLVYGLGQAAQVLGLSWLSWLRGPVGFRTVLAAGAVALAAGLLGLGGVIAPRPEGRLETPYARFFLELMPGWAVGPRGGAGAPAAER